MTGKKRRELIFASTKEFYDFIHSSLYSDLKNSGFTSEQVVEEYDTARETYEGSDEEAYQALQAALDKFREQGSISLKELREFSGGKALK